MVHLESLAWDDNIPCKGEAVGMLCKALGAQLLCPQVLGGEVQHPRQGEPTYQNQTIQNRDDWHILGTISLGQGACRVAAEAKERRDSRHRFAYVLPVLLFMPPRGVGILLPTDGERSFVAVGPERLSAFPAGLPAIKRKTTVFEFRYRYSRSEGRDEPAQNT